MPGRKNFTAPIWCMSIMVLFQLLTLVALYLLMQRYTGQTIPPRGIYVERTVFLVLLVFELIFYVIYRRSVRAKGMAWWHLICLFIAFILLPVIQVVIPLWLSFNGTSGKQLGEIFDIWSYILRGLFWTILVLGHIFFGLLLMKGLYRKEDEPVLTEEQGLLDDYAEE